MLTIGRRFVSMCVPSSPPVPTFAPPITRTPLAITTAGRSAWNVERQYDRIAEAAVAAAYKALSKLPRAVNTEDVAILAVALVPRVTPQDWVSGPPEE